MLPWIKMNLKVIEIINLKRRMATKGDAPRRVRSPTVREGLIGYLTRPHGRVYDTTFFS